MTTSSFDHEALTALRKVNAMLARDNLNWQEVVDRLKSKAEPARPKPARNKNKSAPEKPPRESENGQRDDAEEINRMFDVLLKKVSPKSSFYEFVADVHSWWEYRGYLTSAQYVAIKKAYGRCA
jgi:uncharacterized iron-regulated membrane protein